MTSTERLAAFARALDVEWRALVSGGLQFAHGAQSQLMLLALVAILALLLLGRTALRRRPGRTAVVVPALPAGLGSSLPSRLVHVPTLLFLIGLPFLALSVADPSTALVRREATYPGRRICLAIDASNSMSSHFATSSLKVRDGGDQAFFTTVAAAERFVQMRIDARFKDLVGLVEFGSEAYVVTPFTNDYENILLSLSLIGDPHEFAVFPDPRTLIAVAIEQSVALFKAFDFLNAAGNLLVIFSDGEDTNATVHGRPLDDIIRAAVDAHVPVYFVRTNYNRLEGDPQVPDSLWREAVRKTGGQFFAASDERSLLAAIKEIDQVSAGTVELTEYSKQQPRFPFFALAAAFCFIVATSSRLLVPAFQKFP